MAVVEISNVYELEAIKNALDSDYIQVNNIDASETSTWNGGEGWEPIGTSEDRFIGTYDGDGYTCSNLYINRDSGDVALWGYIGGTGDVKRMGLDDIDITGDYPAGFVAFNEGTISESYTTGVAITPNEYDAYGFVVSNNGTISDSYAIVDLSGHAYIYGFGDNFHGTLIHCWSASNITITDTPKSCYGFAKGGTANDCFWDKDNTNLDPEDQGSEAMGTGKTTSEMQDIDTYTPEWSIAGVSGVNDRDTSETWNIVDGESYPFLSWEPFGSIGSIQAVATLVGRGFRPTADTSGNIQAIATLHGEGFAGPAVLHARGYGSITVIGSIEAVGYKQPKASPSISSIATLSPVGHKESLGIGSIFAIARIRGSAKLFEIWNQAQLEAVANAPNENYRVMKDITVSAFTTIPELTGFLSGNGHSIVGLQTTLISENNGTIDLLCIRHGGGGSTSLVETNNNLVKRCCGRNYTSDTPFIEINTGNVEKCFTRDLIISRTENLGGLIGASSNGQIKHCYSLDCEISGDDAIGGLIGQTHNDYFYWVYASNNLPGNTHVGGVAGEVL